MRAACAWAPFLIGHFRATLGEAGEPEERRKAHRLATAIHRLGLRVLTEREAFNLVDGADVPSMAEFQPVLKELLGRNYLRLAKSEESSTRSRGRPASPVYDVNPALFA